jgi:multidrug resistance efflux pump
VEGTVQRAITAPFDGFVAAAPARAGDRVAAGEMLARLDDRDLALERLRLVTERRRRQLEYERAVAARDRAEANIKQIQIRQADARIELIDARIARAPMRAPFDGLVVAGDLSQSIGAAVARGEVLLEVAPLDDYRVVMEVEERVIDDVEPGQTGTLLAAALPNTPIPIEVEKVTPVARYGDGRTTFEVEAAVTGDADRLRPGMQGAAKIDVEEQRLIAIWTRPLLDWLRLHAWRWSG